MVNKRYEGNKTIIQHDIQALISFPGLTKELHSALRQLLDAVQQHIRTLKRLGQPTDSWDSLFIHLFTPKLDGNTRKEWESERADKQELPSMKDFVTFLEPRCSFLEALSRTGALSVTKGMQNCSKQQSSKHSNQMQVHVSTENSTCPICQNTHKIFGCLIFCNMSVQVCMEKVKDSKLCYNCNLKPFHGKNVPTGHAENVTNITTPCFISTGLLIRIILHQAMRKKSPPRNRPSNQLQPLENTAQTNTLALK